MKVNLLLDDPANVRTEYLNIDPFAQMHTEILVRDDLKKLARVCDAECEELLALNIIDYFPPQEINEVITNWIRKLRHHGLITISFTELYLLVKDIKDRGLNLEEANLAIHGNQQKPWRVRRCTPSMEYIMDLLKSNNIKILSKRLIGHTAIIKGMRP
jgi:hypothetical protein